jgi:hypothetical protein
VNEKRFDDAAIQSKNWDGRCSEEITRPLKAQEDETQGQRSNSP